MTLAGYAGEASVALGLHSCMNTMPPIVSHEKSWGRATPAGRRRPPRRSRRRRAAWCSGRPCGYRPALSPCRPACCCCGRGLSAAATASCRCSRSVAASASASGGLSSQAFQPSRSRLVAAFGSKTSFGKWFGGAAVYCALWLRGRLAVWPRSAAHRNENFGMTRRALA